MSSAGLDSWPRSQWRSPSSSTPISTRLVSRSMDRLPLPARLEARPGVRRKVRHNRLLQASRAAMTSLAEQYVTLPAGVPFETAGLRDFHRFRPRKRIPTRFGVDAPARGCLPSQGGVRARRPRLQEDHRVTAAGAGARASCVRLATRSDSRGGEEETGDTTKEGRSEIRRPFNRRGAHGSGCPGPRTECIRRQRWWRCARELQ